MTMTPMMILVMRVEMRMTEPRRMAKRSLRLSLELDKGYLRRRE